MPFTITDCYLGAYQQDPDLERTYIRMQNTKHETCTRQRKRHIFIKELGEEEKGSLVVSVHKQGFTNLRNDFPGSVLRWVTRVSRK